MKIFLWGAGKILQGIIDDLKIGLPDYKDNDVFSVKGIIDTDFNKAGMQIDGIKILLPEDVSSNMFDFIVVTTKYYEEIKELAKKNYNICEDKIKPGLFLLKLLLMYKYRYTEDREILATLDYLKTNDLSMYNNFIQNQTRRELIHWDKKNKLPYVEFFNCKGILKKMYYPREYSFEIVNERKVVNTYSYEQQKGSPHLYCFNGHIVKKGDCIVDAGACEGNFSLNYADVASQLYLFEPDETWEEAYYYTFSEYKEKMHIYQKKLSDSTNDQNITLDRILHNKKVDFVKMDIEGSEIDALRGGIGLFSKYDVKSSICTYHRSNDQEMIKKFFESIGYNITYSKGVVVFIWNKDIWKTLDFRKCMAYAERRSMDS